MTGKLPKYFGKSILSTAIRGHNTWPPFSEPDEWTVCRVPISEGPWEKMETPGAALRSVSDVMLTSIIRGGFLSTVRLLVLDLESKQSRAYLTHPERWCLDLGSNDSGFRHDGDCAPVWAFKPHPSPLFQTGFCTEANTRWEMEAGSSIENAVGLALINPLEVSLRKGETGDKRNATTGVAISFLKPPRVKKNKKTRCHLAFICGSNSKINQWSWTWRKVQAKHFAAGWLLDRIVIFVLGFRSGICKFRYRFSTDNLVIPLELRTNNIL